MQLIDKDIAEKIAKHSGLSLAKLGLRFDKVVVRLLSNIRSSISADNPRWCSRVSDNISANQITGKD